MNGALKALRRLTRTSVADEVSDELAFHIEMTMRDLIQQGLSAAEARTEAERRFGDTAAINERCRLLGEQRDRIVRRAEHFAEFRQDTTLAVRQLAKAPGFSAIAVLTLAVGIGATAAIFSALDTVVLRSLPFPDADAIVAVHTQTEGIEANVTPPQFLAYRAVDDFRYVAAARLGGGVTLQLGDLPEMVDAAAVSADYFAVFGVQPQHGRTFTREEDTAGGPAAIVLSHRFWMRRFNGDVAVLNSVLKIDGTQRVVVGIMPASFDFMSSTPNIFTPLALAPEAATQYGAHYLQAFARIKPDVSIARARISILAAERRVARDGGKKPEDLAKYKVDLHRFSDDLVQGYRTLLFILLGAVGFVLFIACANVANLLLARGNARARELAIRAALGAGRGRLFRQLLTESLVLSSTGALAGLAVAFGLIRVLRAVSPSDVPRIEQATIDWRVLAVTLLLGAASSVFFGLVPALRAARTDMQDTLRKGSRGAGMARDALRPILVGAQVSLTLALLVGSGLLIKSAWRIQQVNPGFEPRGVLTARLVLPQVRYPTGDAIVRFYQSVREEAARVPGAASVALTSVVPLSPSTMRSAISADGQQRRERVEANLRMASDGYFETMRIPFVAGRDISRADLADGVPVVVVSEALIRTLWPGTNPRDAIGKRVGAFPTRREDLKHWEIVGVVGDIHDAALTSQPEPEMYVPYVQTADAFWPFAGRSLVLVVRLEQENTPPETLVRALQRAIARVDPALPIADSKSMDGYVRETLATVRMNTLLLSTLGGIALLLATVGIYGVVAYFVSQRTQEIGVRTALGATPGDIWRFVIQRGLKPVGAGLVIGLALAYATSALLKGQLYGVTSQDPSTFFAVGLLLLVVALLAMYVPARRAMRVPPVVALGA